MEKARKEQHQSGETWYTEWSSLRGHLEIEGLLLFSPVLLIGPPPQSCWWYAETIWRRWIMLSVKTLNSRSLFCLSSAIRTSLTIPHHTQPRMFASFLHCSPLWVTWQTSVLYSDKLSHFFLIKTKKEEFFFGHTAHRILVPRPRIELASLAWQVQSLNHWTTKGRSPFSPPSHGLQLVPFRTSPQFIRRIYVHLYHHTSITHNWGTCLEKYFLVLEDLMIRKKLPKVLKQAAGEPRTGSGPLGGDVTLQVSLTLHLVALPKTALSDLWFRTQSSRILASLKVIRQIHDLFSCFKKVIFTGNYLFPYMLVLFFPNGDIYYFCLIIYALKKFQ